jgi:hypothetical protein
VERCNQIVKYFSLLFTGFSYCKSVKPDCPLGVVPPTGNVHILSFLRDSGCSGITRVKIAVTFARHYFETSNDRDGGYILKSGYSTVLLQMLAHNSPWKQASEKKRWLKK